VFKVWKQEWATKVLYKKIFKIIFLLARSCIQTKVMRSFVLSAVLAKEMLNFIFTLNFQSFQKARQTGAQTLCMALNRITSFGPTNRIFEIDPLHMEPHLHCPTMVSSLIHVKQLQRQSIANFMQTIRYL
jgi:hypothetical protein